MITISNKPLSYDDILRVCRHGEKITLSEEIRQKIKIGENYIKNIVENEIPVYGVNTGFGDFEKVSIAKNQVKELQRNIIRSHAIGTGGYVDTEIVRAMLLLRVYSLSRGYSGIRLYLVEYMVNMLNLGISPRVPEKGSVGASGDLVPLAHMSLAMMGEWDVEYQGEVMPAKCLFDKLGIEPLVLQEKEGLSLINGTQMITSIGSLAAYDSHLLARYADIAAALSGDVMNSTDKHTTPIIHQLKAHNGQIATAKNIAMLLKGSEVRESHRNCGKIQDPYTIRCIPQIHGASKDAINYCLGIFRTEMNSVTDNPLVIPEDEDVFSAGNFHGQPVALASDFLSIAVAELGNVSERRIARLVDKGLNKILPHFLVEKGGLNSGFMIPQYTAAALVSESKTLAHPASVDSIPTSANQEDHVSMGNWAARKCREIIKNTRYVLAIEFMNNTQALEFRRPLKSSPCLETFYSYIRDSLGVPFVEDDIFMKPHVDKIDEALQSDELLKEVESVLGSTIEC